VDVMFNVGLLFIDWDMQLC